jgi:hypothetical protein
MMSVGIHVTFGKFRTIHLGYLTKPKEFELMCPTNPIGTVDVLLGLHHGQASSNSPVLNHALRPRVGIMNNGTRKGGEPETMMSVHTIPGFEDLWQLHFSLLGGQEYTQPGLFIANLPDEPPAAIPTRPWLRRCPAPPRRPRQRTTDRRSGSSSQHSRTARSPSQTRATSSARRTRRKRGQISRRR